MAIWSHQQSIVGPENFRIKVSFKKNTDLELQIKKFKIHLGRRVSVRWEMFFWILGWKKPEYGSRKWKAGRQIDVFVHGRNMVVIVSWLLNSYYGVCACIEQQKYATGPGDGEKQFRDRFQKNLQTRWFTFNLPKMHRLYPLFMRLRKKKWRNVACFFMIFLPKNCVIERKLFTSKKIFNFTFNFVAIIMGRKIKRVRVTYTTNIKHSIV